VLDSKQPGRNLDPELVARTCQERQSLRGTGRLLNVSHRTVLNWLKKKPGNSLISSPLHNTLRQRVSQFVRKTLPFSKKEYMLNLHFKLFAYHYLNVVS
jgi:hypothetical protein